MDPMSYDFPTDLIEASLTSKNLREQLDALPVDELLLADGTPLERKRAASLGRAVKAYSEEEQAEVETLRAARLKAATLVVTHGFWESVPAEEQMKARSALKHHGEPA